MKYFQKNTFAAREGSATRHRLICFCDAFGLHCAFFKSTVSAGIFRMTLDGNCYTRIKL